MHTPGPCPAQRIDSSGSHRRAMTFSTVRTAPAPTVGVHPAVDPVDPEDIADGAPVGPAADGAPAAAAPASAPALSPVEWAGRKPAVPARLARSVRRHRG
ncbi:hypothetical protein GCM10028787_28320 [Brachybacterium horti]